MGNNGPKIGFIGLGDQGGPMAQMILKTGFDLTIWARRKEVRAQYVILGAKIADSPQALARHCDILCLCVTDDEAVQGLLHGQNLLTVLRKGAIIAQHSTINPALCEQLAQDAAQHGIEFLDLPVSGSGHAALAKQLLIFAGGDEAKFEAVRPMLNSYAGNIIHMGAAGDAMRAKLLNNLMAAVNIGQAAMLLDMAEEMEMDAAKVRKAILVATGRSYGMEAIIRLQKTERAAHILSILRKDVNLALQILPAEHEEEWKPLAQRALAMLEKFSTDAKLSRY